MPRRLRRLPAAVPILVLACLALWLAACGGAPRRAAVPSSPLAESVTIGAIGLVGTPYRYGGNTPAGGFDCSGLIGHVYRELAGLSLPRTVAALSDDAGARVAPERLRSGDLVFFAPGGGRVSHAGIYVGAGRFVHAPSSGGTVRLDFLDRGYWQGQLRFGRRPLP